MGSRTWNLELNEQEIRAEATLEGDPNTFIGHVVGYPDQIARIFISPRLIRGFIFDGTYMQRIISIEEYGTEFHGQQGVYVLTSNEEEPYSYEPDMEDCANPVVEFGIFADYEFYQFQNQDVDLAIDRILAAMQEAHFVYETNFNLDIRIVGPLIYTNDDGLGQTIGSIGASLSDRWRFLQPCVNADVLFLFSGANLAGGGMANGFTGCYHPVEKLYPFAYVDWRAPLILPGGRLPGWYLALIHEMGHLFGATEEEFTTCKPECSTLDCMPPIMCQTELHCSRIRCTL